MVSIQPELLGRLAQLFHENGTASLVVTHGENQRSIHVSNGVVIGADSNIKAERFGSLVVAARRLDHQAIEAAAALAKRNKSLLGDQLVGLQLLSAAELADFLELQVRVRFDQALVMGGTVEQKTMQLAQPTFRRPLGAMLLSAFRERLGFEPVQRIWRTVVSRPLRLTPLDDIEGRLSILPSERDVWRRLPQLLRDPHAQAALTQGEVRFLAALVALQVLLP